MKLVNCIEYLVNNVVTNGISSNIAEYETMCSQLFMGQLRLFMTIFTYGNTFEYIICIMKAILLGQQCHIVIIQITILCNKSK